MMAPNQHCLLSCKASGCAGSCEKNTWWEENWSIVFQSLCSSKPGLVANGQPLLAYRADCLVGGAPSHCSRVYRRP